MIGVFVGFSCIPLNAELNPTCHLLALLGDATIVVVSRLRVKCQRFGTLCLFHLHTHSPMKLEQTECSERLVFKLQTPGNNPEESIRNSKQGESLKSRKY